jgi:hypothetical protein
VILTTIWWWKRGGGRRAVSNEPTHRVHLERFNLKKFNEVEGEEQYGVEISNRFAALENLDTMLYSDRVWGTLETS